MVLRVSDPVLMRELLAFLESRADAIAVMVSEDEIEIAALGDPPTSPCPWSSGLAPGARCRDSGRGACPWRA